jgi:serine/threonine protein kinase
LLYRRRNRCPGYTSNSIQIRRDEGNVIARASIPPRLASSTFAGDAYIVTVHDFGQSGGFFYLLMEFVEGVNLRQAMQAGRFTPQQAMLLVPKISGGILAEY